MGNMDELDRMLNEDVTEYRFPPPVDDFLQGLYDQIRDLTEQREAVETNYRRVSKELADMKGVSEQLKLQNRVIEHLLDRLNW